MPKFIPLSARPAVWNLMASLGVAMGEVEVDYSRTQRKIFLEWVTTGDLLATLTLNVHTGEWEVE